MGLFGKGAIAAECGNCGKGVAFDITTCPHCSTAIEEDIAKCSHRASWIPAKAERCPKCNTEFGTFRTEWGMRSNDRKILLPGLTEERIAEMAAKYAPPKTARPVDEPPGGGV